MVNCSNQLSPTGRRLRYAVVLTLALALALALAGCANGDSTVSRAYLDPGTDRTATIHALDEALCHSHLRRAASFERFWVGTCSDRTLYEKPVYFQVFTSAAGKRTYLRRFEACVAGTYLQGPRWIALAARPSDARIVARAGGVPLACTNTRLPPA